MDTMRAWISKQLANVACCIGAAMISGVAVAVVIGLLVAESSPLLALH